MNRYFKILTIVSVILITIIVPSCGKKKQKETSENIVSVQVIKPILKDYQQILTFSGVTQSPFIINTSFMVPGEISKLNFKVGQKIEKGQILGLLDPKTYMAQAETARSQVGLAESNLNKVYAGYRKEEKEVAKMQMLQAKAKVDQAKREFNRYKAVYKVDAVPLQQYEQVKTEYEIAKKQYKAAKEQYILTKKGATPEERQVAKANVNVAQKTLNQAEIQLSYVVLRSPVSGIIAKKAVEEGAVVNTGTSIYEILQKGKMNFIIKVPSVHIDNIFIGQKANISFIEISNDIIKAKVIEIQPVSDISTRSYRVKLQMASTPNFKDYSGTIGKCQFNIGESIKGISVPIACLLKNKEDKNFYIYIIDEKNKAHKVNVKISRIKEQNAIIQENIPKNSNIVISGQEYLNEGAKVKIVEALNSQKIISPNKTVIPIKDQQKI